MSDRTPGHALDVVLLADRTPPAIGGRESVLREILRRQPPERTRLVAAQASGAGSFDRACPVPIHRRPQLAMLGEGGARWLRRTHLHWILRRRPPGMIVAFGLAGEGSLALETKRATGAPYVLHLEGPELHAARRDLRAAGERARQVQEILDESESIFVASRACRLEAYKAGVLPHRLEVILPGVDLERFCPGPKPESLAKRHGLSRGPVLLTVAGRGPAKDPDTVLRAFAAVRAQKNGAALLVLGPADAVWRSRAAELRAQAGVVFAGTVSEDALPDYYRLADLFVLAHRESHEAGVVAGVEVAFAEALASGLPIVATRAGSAEELVPSEEVGFLVEAEAHAKMARAALDVLRTAELHEELRRAARQRAVEEHAADVRGARFRELLEVVYYRRLSRGRLAHEEEPQPAARPAA
ncbi:MAG: glycosyltransferase family 4 protein [bacterium]